MPLNKFIPTLFLCVLWLHMPGQVATYVDDIKPILDRHCVSCHQAGEAGAMPLTTYEEVTAYGRMIQYVTTSKLMPPWYADPSYSHFANERVLTAEEIKTISDWVSSGMAHGSAPVQKESMSIPAIAPERKPDLVISMHEAFEQYGIYLDQYQVFVLPTMLDEDTWVEGIEFVPGNKKIVRFAGISVETSDKFDSLDRWDPRYGYYSFGGPGKTTDEPFWYTWSPQQKPTFYQDNTAKYLPKGSNLIVHIHYGPTGKPQTDSSSIRLYLSSKKLQRRWMTAPLINPYTLSADSLFIPANTKKIFHAAYTVPYDLEIKSLTPQANLLCRNWEIYAKLPGETAPLKLLKINEWNFNWKQTYHLERPVFLPEGTVIHTLALFDNTTGNPCNPSDQPVDFKWGAHLFSELFFVHFELRPAFKSGTGVKLLAPSVVSEDSLEILLSVDKTGFYRSELCGASMKDCVLLHEGRLKKGTHPLSFPTDHIPYGNYIIQVSNQHGMLMAEQLIVKMMEGGL